MRSRPAVMPEVDEDQDETEAMVGEDAAEIEEEVMHAYVVAEEIDEDA